MKDKDSKIYKDALVSLHLVEGSFKNEKLGCCILITKLSFTKNVVAT